MNYPNILLWGNNTYHRLNTWDLDNSNDTPKYIKIGISGTIESWRVLTYQEVMDCTNNAAKPCKDMLEVHTSYYG